MCGRYSLSQPEKIQKRFKTQNEVLMFESSYNVAPSQTLPVITRNSPNKITMMRWGFTWSKDAKHGPINIRKETTKEKPYFKKILLNQRCIIPGDGFYEWKTVKLEGHDEKYPFYIHHKDRVLFGFAGLYNKLIDAEGKPLFSFAIITCPSNEKVKEIHHRMPVILKEKDENLWLDPKDDDFEKLFKILKPYPPENIKFYPISIRVNNPRNDDENIIKPFKEQKQT
jgi:putative SOS response-associated peptidase YedK